MKEQNSHQDKKWAELARSLFDGDSSEGQKLNEKEWEEDELAEIRKLKGQLDLHYKRQAFDANQAFEKITPKITQVTASKKQSNMRWLRVAAAIVFALLLGGGAIWYSQFSAVSDTLVQTDQFGLQKITLEDGSVVTLNHGSTLQYPEQFAGNIREVSLDGEAFFEVAPNPDKPFIIHAGDANIEVLGTSFNVNAYPENVEVSVVVATGKVKVTANQAGAPEADLILLPGDRGVLRKQDLALQKSRNPNPNYLAWKTHSFDFEISSLRDVIEQLSTVYRVKITTADPEMEKLLLTARFDNQSVPFILEVIARTHDLEIEHKADGTYELRR